MMRKGGQQGREEMRIAEELRILVRLAEKG
jgi:hypothetical protein